MIDRLTDTIAAVCPIHGVSGTTNTRIDYRDEATAEQRAAAQSALAAFDASQAAHEAWQRQKRREAANELFTATTPEAMAMRALSDELIDVIQQVLKGVGKTPRSRVSIIDSVRQRIMDGRVDTGIPLE